MDTNAKLEAVRELEERIPNVDNLLAGIDAKPEPPCADCVELMRDFDPAGPGLALVAGLVGFRDGQEPRMLPFTIWASEPHEVRQIAESGAKYQFGPDAYILRLITIGVSSQPKRVLAGFDRGDHECVMRMRDEADELTEAWMGAVRRARSGSVAENT